MARERARFSTALVRSAGVPENGVVVVVDGDYYTVIDHTVYSSGTIVVLEDRQPIDLPETVADWTEFLPPFEDWNSVRRDVEPPFKGEPQPTEPNTEG